MQNAFNFQKDKMRYQQGNPEKPGLPPAIDPAQQQNKQQHNP